MNRTHKLIGPHCIKLEKLVQCGSFELTLANSIASQAIVR